MLAPRFGALLVVQTKDERRRRAMYRMNEMEFWIGRGPLHLRAQSSGRA
jgi:hypothetical protein